MGKPVIFIPGFPGTDLHTRDDGKKIYLKLKPLLNPSDELLRQLQGPNDLAALDPIVAGEPVKRLAKILIFELFKQAGTLYDILDDYDLELVKFGYDWRRPVWDDEMQLRLEQAVRKLRQTTGEKVTAIVHSTGGLVLRRLVERKPSLVAMFERVIAFGVPWAGLLKTLRYMDGKEGMLTIKKHEAQRIIAHSWAAADLLPPDPANSDMRDAQGDDLNMVVDGNGRQTSPLVKTGWYKPELRHVLGQRATETGANLGHRKPTFDIGDRVLPVTNVVGWGAPTLVQAKITGSGNSQSIAYAPAVMEPGALDGGDGTAPWRSASWLRGDHVTTYHVPVGYHRGAKKYPHSSLWRNPGGRNLLDHFLGGDDLKSFVYAAVAAPDFAAKTKARARVWISALDADGKPLENVEIRAVDLESGSSQPTVKALGSGRHRLSLPRGRMRLVQNDKFRRTTLRISWDGGSVDRVVLVNEQGG